MPVRVEPSVAFRAVATPGASRWSRTRRGLAEAVHSR
jgi:hypothetical protein